MSNKIYKKLTDSIDEDINEISFICFTNRRLSVLLLTG